MPEPTLRDIELGKFKLTGEVGMKIVFAIGVNPRSLFSDDEPILDLSGKPLSKDSAKADELTGATWFRSKTTALRHLCEWYGN